LINTNNIAGLALNGIVYSSSGFNHSGNFLTMNVGVMDNAGNNTNSMILNLGAAQSFSNNAPSTSLVFGGAITNNGFGLTIEGSGDVFINGVLGGTNASSVASGGLTMNGSSTNRLAGANTFIGGLTINAGTVRLANAAAIPSGAGRGDVTIANGATLDLSANSQTINGLYGSGTVDNLAGTATYTLTVGNNATNSGGSFGGSIQNSSGTVALSKVNTNTFTLTGTSTYTGITTINAGTLALGASASISSPTVNILPGAVLDDSAITGGLPFGSSQTLVGGRTTNGGPNDIVGTLNSGGAITIYKPGLAGTLNVSGGLTLSGGSISFDLGGTNTPGAGTNDIIFIHGPLSLSGTTTLQLNPYAGAYAASGSTYTLISNSTMTVSGSAANLAADVPRGVTAIFDTTTQPGSVLLGITGTFSPATLIWNGASGASWDVNTSQNWLNGNTPDYFFNLDNVIFNDVGNGNVTVATGVSPGSTLFNNKATNYVLSGSGGAIAGTGPVTVKGGGTVTFNTPNNYTGDTIVNNGSTLILGVLPTPPHITVYNGVALGNLRLNGGGVFLADNPNDTYRANFNNLIVGPGAGAVSMRNRQSSSSYIYQFNTLSRSVGGTLDFNNMQSKATSPQVALLITNTLVANGILGGWASYGTAAQAPGSDWLVPVATGAGSTAYAAYQTTNNPTVWGVSSNVSLTANPSANLNNTVINSIKLAGSTVTINSGQSLSLLSGGVLMPNAGSAAAINGGTLLGATNADVVVLGNSAIGALTIGAAIADNTNGAATSGSALTKSGWGTLILTGANTYTGPTFINGPTTVGTNAAAPSTLPAGTLQLGNGGTSGSISNSAGVTNNGTLTFNRSDSVTFGLLINGIGGVRNLGSGTTILTANNAFSGATTISAGTLQVGNGGTTGTLGTSPSVTDNGTLAFNRSDNISFSAPISGIGGLTKLGGGRLTLSGTQTYQGATTVSAGTLALDASASIGNSSPIVVAGGTTLDVSATSSFTLVGGIVNQALSGSGGVAGNLTTAPGTSISPATNGTVGTLVFSNNLTISGGTLYLDVGNASRDLIIVTTNLALNAGTIQLNVVGGALANGTYKIIQYSGSLSGSVANLSVSGFSQPGQEVALSSANAGEIDLVVSAYVALPLVWKGDGVNNLWDLATANWLNGASASVFHQFDNTTFDDTGSDSPSISLQTTLSPALVTINATQPYTLAGGGKISGGATLIKTNSGTLTVTTANDYGGTTTISAGTVQVSDGVTAGSLGAGTITNNAILNYNEPADATLSSVIAGNGSLTHQAANTLSLTANNTLSGSITISTGTLQIGAGGGSGSLGTASVTDNGTLLFNRSGTVTVSGSISGSGTFAKIGPAIMTLSGANTYQGNTYISNGVVKLGASEVIPDGGATTGWLILDGSPTVAGELDLNGFNETVNALAGLSDAVVGKIVNNSGTATNTLTVNSIADTTYSGFILDNDGSGGNVRLVKLGANTQTLQPGGSGNLYSGGTIVGNGTLALGSAAANSLGLGSGTVTLTNNGTLRFAGATGNTAPEFIGNGNTILVPAGQSGTIILPQRCVAPGLSGIVTGGGTLSVLVSYVRGNIVGNWTGFSNQINVGIGPGATPNEFRMGMAGFPNAALYLTNGVLMDTINANGRTVDIGELDGDSGATLGPGNGSSTGPIWRIGAKNTSSTFPGSILDAGTTALLKVGSGTLTLNGTCSYNGATTVSNGVLALAADTAASANSTPFNVATLAAVLDVSGLSSGTLNLGSSQALQGVGTVRGSVTTSGTVSPGESIGTLTVTNVLTMSGTALMEIDRANSPTSDKLVANSFVINPGSTLTVNNIGSTNLKSGDTFVLFNQAVSGFTTITLPPLPCGNLFWVTNLALNGSISVGGTSCTNTTPTTITTTIIGGTNLVLSWPEDHTGWRLQVQTNSANTGLSNNWSIVNGSGLVNNITNGIDQHSGTVFYRMIYP
jgi:autotransporter-associated beta strand protein